MLGIIGGTSILYARLPKLEKKIVATPFGKVEVNLGDIALVMRHQFNTPPHKLNHAASISALAICGVDKLVAFGSTGSLKSNISIGDIILPDDYYSPSDIPSINNNFIKHSVPSVDKNMINLIHESIPDTIVGGTYVQTKGPRFETAAEIQALKNIGDVVGMTVASEAAIANELSIPFASVCSVDNYCNGLAPEKLSYDCILAKSKDNAKRMEDIISKTVEIFG